MPGLPNVHPNPLSGLSEDYDIPDDWEDHAEDPEETEIEATLWQQELESHL